jgi:hypothetical protein
MSAATWPPPNVRRGFRRLYLILAVPWLVVFTIGFAIATYDYVHDDAEFNRLDAEFNAMVAHGKPDDPASDELLRVSDDLSHAFARCSDAEDGMVKSFVRGIGPPPLIFLIWHALIWIGSGFQRDEAA